MALKYFYYYIYIPPLFCTTQGAISNTLAPHFTHYNLVKWVGLRKSDWAEVTHLTVPNSRVSQFLVQHLSFAQSCSPFPPSPSPGFNISRNFPTLVVASWYLFLQEQNKAILLNLGTLMKFWPSTKEY